MNLDNLKKYIDENKSIVVSNELKSKTIDVAYSDNLSDMVDKPIIKILPNRKKRQFKRIATVAACLLLTSIVGFSVIFSGLFKVANDVVMSNGYVPLETNKSSQIYNEVFYSKCINYDESPTNSIIENPIIKTFDENKSTFSIDVDTASYVNFRKYMSEMSLIDFQKSNFTIRTEEAINYFDYSYNKPTGEHPIAVTTTVGDCTWNKNAKLAVITLAGKELEVKEQAGSNIVFLVDVSGSMSSENKLPLLKQALTMAINNLNEKDTVSIVTYASGVKTVLSGVKGNEKDDIISALNNLVSNGSTAGANGLELAYNVAQDYFIKEGNNRILLATDGDFNVGPSSTEEMKELVTKKRESGIFLSVLGFGVNINSGDSRLETLADNGNGGYYVIDNLSEGENILSKQFSSTLYTIAKDVKLQVEFNKNAVESYRLIGYENRVLANQDFENDTVDAGDMGSGQNVTAIYEIILKEKADENLFNVNVRYKNPNSDESKLYEHTAQINKELNSDFYFVSAVAEACLFINNSKYKGNATIEHAYTMASDYADDNKNRVEFAEILNKIIKE